VKKKFPRATSNLFNLIIFVLHLQNFHWLFLRK